MPNALLHPELPALETLPTDARAPAEAPQGQGTTPGAEQTTHWLALPEDEAPTTTHEGYDVPLLTADEMRGNRLRHSVRQAAPAIGRAAVGRVDSPMGIYPVYPHKPAAPQEGYEGRHRAE